MRWPIELVVMAITDTAMVAIHLVFAGIWAGGVAFMAFGVLPTARAGDIAPEPLASIAGRVTIISRTSAVVLLLSGGYLAGSIYTAESLLGSGDGHLVVTMVVLWLVLTALVEVGTRRLREGLERDTVRESVRVSLRPYQAAAAVGIVLLLIGGVLVA